MRIEFYSCLVNDSESICDVLGERVLVSCMDDRAGYEGIVDRKVSKTRITF